MSRAADKAPNKSPPLVRLVPMTDAERRSTLEGQAVEYADSKARAGIWIAEEALARSREEIRSLVGPDPEARGHEFFVAVDAGGQRVGWLWLGPVPSPEVLPDRRWLFQIVIDEPFRGRGFGRGLLAAAEQRVLEEGRHELALNVFRWNAVAVSLYSSAGYEVALQDDKSIGMRKRLSPD